MTPEIHPSTASGERHTSGPLVSIIIDNYNYERFLRDTIDSALGQTFADIEVIVVDDGSTDNSADIIRSYSNRVIAVLKRNGGHASAFNAGFSASHGSIVLFLDADDVLLPNAVEEIVRSWRPQTAKAQFVLAHIDAEGHRLGGCVPYAPATMPEGDIRELILARGGYVTPPTSGNAFARSVLERLLPLPDSEWRQAADTALEILAPFLGELVSLRSTLGLYRIHSTNHGAIGGDLDARKLRVKLIIDKQREQALIEFAARAGFSVPADWVAREPGHLKYRLASMRFDPEHHPFLDDTRWSLALAGVTSSWTNPHHSLRSRIFHSIWFPSVALLPRVAADPLIRMGLVPRQKRARRLNPGPTPSNGIALK